MVHVPDRNAVDEAVWSEAVAREAVIRRLVSLERRSRSDFLHACRELGLRRTRLYELIRAYREHPLTSSLLPQPAGTRRGSRRLPDETEALIAEALRDFYKTRQKPSINQLHKEIRRLCRLRGVRAPSWHAVKARIVALEPAELIAARNGSKAARDRFRPVPGQYEVEHAFDVVQIWAGRLDRPLRVSYDPRDLSTVFVRGPDGAQWPIRFADLRRPPITLSEHRRARADLRERGLALVDEQLIFETIEAQRALVHEAARRTKAARQLAEKRDRALGAAKPNRSPTPAKPQQAEDDRPIDWSKVPIFPVEEWS